MITYIYIDESGNLGMNSKDKYFIVSAIKIEDENTHKKLIRIPKKIRQKKLKKKLKQVPELKFTNSSPEIRIKFLKEISKLDLEIYSVIIDKSLTCQKLQNKLMTLYKFLLKILLEKVFISINNNFNLKIVIDRCMNKTQRENFKEYIESEFLKLFKIIPSVEIEQENSQNKPGLQVVDFVSGSFGFKYNTGKNSDDPNRYLEIIQNKIKCEKNDLFK